MRNKKLWKGMVAGIMSVALLTSGIAVQPKKTEAAVYATQGAYGVGVGKQIPDHVFAPFVDIVSYVSDKDYASAGSLSLEKMYKDTGILYYNLGFIMTKNGGGITNGIVDWSWGGYETLSENSSNTWQLDGIKESIRYIRSKGGDVVVSIGGLNEGNLFQKTQDEDILFNTYMDIIEGYGLTRLDLDIEGGGQGKAINVANAKALKRVQDATGVEIVLTLPVLPSGLTSLGLGTMEAYIENGVDVKMVNIMAMCYGSGVINPGETYAQASVRAIDNTAQQIKTTYANNGKTLSNAQAYEKVGVTVSIGEESSSFPIWTTDYSQVVNQKAISSNIGMTSFWCLNRDCQKYGQNNGIYGMYEHTNIFKTFMGDNAYQIPTDIDDETETGAGGETISAWKRGNAYVQGDLVIYDGKVWEAQWWTQGIIPGDADNGAYPWKYIRDVSVEPEPTTQEPTTAEPTTQETSQVALEINGCQISTTLGGFRMVYSVSDPKKEISEVGLVYGLGAKDTEMVLNSSNTTVYHYQTTDEGKLSSSTEETGKYAMTMKLIRNAAFYQSEIDVRIYAKLKNGKIIYSPISKLTIFNVAKYLYDNEKMSNAPSHDYLYNNILKIVEPGYTYKAFDVRKGMVQ